MNAMQVFNQTPGTKILLRCEKENVEETIGMLCASIPESIRKRAALNTSPILSMEIIGDDLPNSFHDLATLCNKLIASAGKRSHFSEILLLNIANLLKSAADRARLRALGEVLAIEDGLASQCITVFYGTVTEKESLVAAECLDFDGKLTVAQLTDLQKEMSIAAMLQNAKISYENEATLQLLQKAVDEMRGKAGFDISKFFRSCSEQAGSISERSVRVALDNPYSYINRFKKLEAIEDKKRDDMARRIGF